MSVHDKAYHYLYKITNLINNKFYYGIHSTNDLNDGYLGSGKYIRDSIKKHGKENFKIEYIEFFNDRNILANKERELVNENLLKDPLCMNLKKGGDGGFCEWTLEMRKKRSILSSGKNNPMFGKTRTKSEKEKISKNHANVSGKNNPMFGKTHSLEAKKTLKECMSIKNTKSITCDKCNRVIKGYSNFSRHIKKCEYSLINRSYKLYLDDERFPKISNDWFIVRSFKDFKTMILAKGLPLELSLDHDLMDELTGYDCVKWLVYEMKYDLRIININVHSANPVGKDNIIGLIKSWNNFLNQEEIEYNKKYNSIK